MKKLFALTVAVLTFTGITASPIQAQTQTQPQAQQSQPQAQTQPQMTETKRALIHELITLYNQHISSDQMVNSMMSQMQTLMPQMLNQLISRRTDLTEAQKQEAIDRATPAMQHFATRFREEMLRQIDFKQIQEDISTALYDRYFTETELQDLIAFYRTQTGQKTLQVMPQLMAESMRLSSEQILPKIMQITQQLMQEEMNQLVPQSGNLR